MVSFLRGNEATLHIDESVQPLYFLEASNPQDGPTCDTVVEGVFVLTLARPKTVPRIEVELTGKETMWVSGRHESYETFKKHLTLTPGQLSAGEHRFHWCFVVPANAAAYQVCPYGSTLHYVDIRAIGIGRFGSDVVTSGMVDLVADHLPRAALAEGYDHSKETYHEVLGPLRGRLSSNYLLRGGYLRLALDLPDIGQATRINDVQVILGQEFNLQSMKNPQYAEHKTQQIVLWSLASEDSMPLELEAGKELSLVRQIRLLKKERHDIVRPTTSDWSETGIRVAHQLHICIRFTAVGTSEMKELKITFGAKLSSCACSIENMQLPDYDQHKAVKPQQLDYDGWNRACLCHRPDASELQAIYGSDLKAAPQDLYGHQHRPVWEDKGEGTSGSSG